MKIVFLVTDAWGGHGGIALFNRQFAEALEAEVTVIPRLIRAGMHDIPRNVRFIEEAARGKFAFARAVAAARRERPDLVICGHIHLLPLAFDRPLLVAHGIEAWKRPRNPLAAHGLARTEGVIAVSALTRDRLTGWSGYRGRSWVLPNAVPLEQYGIRPKRLDLVERYALAGRRVLLTVGRLESAERLKGFDEVLDILGDLPEDVVYLIAGGGNDAPRLLRKAQALGVAERVRFTGLFPDEEKVDLYNLADVYVMPSRGEGFGFVFIEAMACGVPAIGSKADGGREALLDGRLGLLVDPANPAELRAAIDEALDHGERRVPEGLDYFSIDRFRERVERIVQEAMQGR